MAEILHVETSALVSLGDGDDEAEVGFGEGGFGAEGATDLFFDLGDGHSGFDGVGPFLVGWWPVEEEDGKWSVSIPSRYTSCVHKNHTTQCNTNLNNCPSNSSLTSSHLIKI